MRTNTTSDMTGLVDYHLHTATSSDAQGSVEDYCERAAQLGLREIAITNHVHLNAPQYDITDDVVITLWENITEQKKHSLQLVVRFGIEVDYFPRTEEKIAERITRYESLLGRPLDYVLGSVHVINGVRFPDVQQAPKLFSGGTDLPALFRQYFRLMSQATQTGLFDVMAHPDLIKRYSTKFLPTVPYAEYRGVAAEFVASLVECDVGMEVNTKGLFHPVGEIYPSRELLSAYLQEASRQDVRPVVTLGSDAHRVEDLGDGLREGVETLRGLGQHAVTVFDRRSKRMLYLQ